MTKSMIKIVALLLIATSGCGDTSSEQSDFAESPPVEVTAERVRLETLPKLYEAPGSIIAATASVLSSEVLGRVTAVHVHEGSIVRRGQPLVTIDDRSAQSRLQEAEATVTAARVAGDGAIHAIRSAEAALRAADANARLALTTYQRYQELLERDSVSPQEFDEVEARYHSAQAELSRAEQALAAAKSREQHAEAMIAQAEAARHGAGISLSQTGIVAPFNGIVTHRQVEPGDLASPGRPLLTLEGTGHYQLAVHLNESIVTELQFDQAVEVSLPSLGLTLQAEIEETEPAADPSTRTVLVKLGLPDHPGIHSGLFGRAAFSIGEEERLFIPQESIIQRGQLVGVMSVDSRERARFQLIKVGRTRRSGIEVLSGLNQGDLIIREPGSVADGQPVRVISPSESVRPQ